MSRPHFEGYDRAALRPTVVHIGPGVFHRAHQAVYGDRVLRTGASAGGIHAISLRSSAVREALAPHDFVYHVVERSTVPGDDVGHEVVRPVGSLLGIDSLRHDSETALAPLTDPLVTVVTITVTEHGYCSTGPGGPLDLDRPEIVHDLDNPRAPRSLPGVLLEALARRRAAGHAPFTIASCDNLPANGTATARVLGDLAECRDPSLAAWVTGNVAFPSSMVDRMVPTTTAHDRERLAHLGIDDPWPVITEPFSQWVLEDVFPAGRPPWERAGVELVADVAPHERAKLRILNAAHSALAYWGLLCDHASVAEAAADAVLLAAVRDLLANEVLPTLDAPPGWDLAAYVEQTLTRFRNQALGYTTAKVAADGSQKLPVRLVPTVRARLAAGASTRRCAEVLGAWVTCIAGPRAAALCVSDAGLGLAPGPDAPSGSWLPPLPRRPDLAVAELLGLPGLLDVADPAEQTFCAEVAQVAAALWDADAHAVLGRPTTIDIRADLLEGA